ncbi:MAG: translation elongation factor Ts [Oscillospiraceae bacterium]|nr:translation elongation factor Ts [Oscillospiraceae bacterium]MDD6502687.1 translation elongation factor Ts [Oscillospiraceae bacterium]MDY4105289.1 translation elongation factor Ts [Oscillospiraceae bacterium]
MASFTAADIKNLREMTGVGMMDCKKALTESDGDMDKAVAWLREKGLAAAQKKAGRIAAEGMSYAAVIDGVGVVVEVNAESDFVAKNELFVAYVKGIAEVVAKENPADLDALMGCQFPGTGRTVKEEQNDKVLVIGENINVRRFARYADGLSVPYIHAGGKIGVLVNMEVSENLAGNDAVVELGKDVAMQIAAMNPSFLDKADVDQATLDKEKEILMAQAIEENKNAAKPKPEAIIEKMVMGRVGKYYEENCLLQQAFVKENKVSVEKHIAEVAKQVGGSIKVTGFIRFATGEGIEKRQDDLAAEVEKLVNNK